MRGLGASHDPRAIGCSPCHRGDPLRSEARAAHRGMVAVPGNLDTIVSTCGRIGCHDAIAARVRGSMMATLRGMIAVDRWAFGEQPTPDGTASAAEIGHTPADSHLRELCVSCHLGHLKEAPAKTGELSRGGGCVACHLVDDPPRTPVRDDPARFIHPRLSVQVRDESCFGCHSRSGRISLAYAGWREADPGEAAALPAPSKRLLADGRMVVRAEEDVHHARGLACIDCHTAQETMGDGRVHRHEEEATHVRCTTCHRIAPARAVLREALDPEAARIAWLRDGTSAASSYLVDDASGEALTNARPLADGSVEVRGKLSRRVAIAKVPAKQCAMIAGHGRLSCQSCHSAWVARCIGCHTERDRRSEEWVEYDVAPGIGAPALGLLERGGAKGIEPFLPGMVLTLNAGATGGRLPGPLPRSAASLITPATRFLRAYAFAAPHTTVRRGRSCISCHLDPFALGYGSGKLELAAERGRTIWRFTPAYERSPFDGLPADAWIPFEDRPPAGSATRTTAGPLERAMQRRALDAGACMTCHDPERDSSLYVDYPASVRRRSPRCRVP